MKLFLTNYHWRQWIDMVHTVVYLWIDDCCQRGKNVYSTKVINTNIVKVPILNFLLSATIIKVGTVISDCSRNYRTYERFTLLLGMQEQRKGK